MIYLYENESGRLVSSTSDPAKVAAAEILAARGYTATGDLPALDATHIWDIPTLTVATIPATTDPVLPTYQFILSFSGDEMTAIRGSVDVNVQRLLYALERTQEIDRTSASVVQGLAYLVAVGLVSQARSDQILGG